MENGGIMIFLLIMVIAILVGGAFLAKKMLIVTDPNAQDIPSDEEADTAQDFIPIVDIKDGMIDLGNHRYRAVIECSSVNYNLKTEREREVIERSYQRFISSISFPITFHIQTKIIDNTVVVRELEKDIERLVTKNKIVTDYAQMYLESMKNFDVYIGNAKQKKKYIIVGYEEAYTLTELSDEEKRELSRQQLNDRVEFIQGQLQAIGIKTEHLDNPKLVDLMYNAYHRDNSQYDLSEALSEGEFFAQIVRGNVNKEDISAEKKIDYELVRLQNLIKEEYLDVRLGMQSDVYKKMAEIYENLDKIRRIVDRPYAGEFKVNTGTKQDVLSKVNTENSYGYMEEQENASFVGIIKEKLNDSNDDWSLDFGDESVEDTEDSWSLDFDSKEEPNELSDSNDDWSLDFGDESVEDTEDSWSLDFDSKEESNELSDSNDDWSLDFGDESVEDTEDSWSLDFDSKEESNELSDSNDDWSLDFGDESVEDTEDSWSLDFDSKEELDSLFEEDTDVVIKNKSGIGDKSKRNKRLIFD